MPINSTLAAVAIMLAIVADLAWHELVRMHRSGVEHSTLEARSAAWPTNAPAPGSRSGNRRSSGRIATIVTVTVLALLVPTTAAPIPGLPSPPSGATRVPIVAAGHASPTATLWPTGAPAATSGAPDTGSPTPTVLPTEAPSESPPPTTRGTPAATPVVTPVPSSGTTRVDHVFLIVMENHSAAQVWNTASTPYITSLGNLGARASNYFAITHPSLPNYLDLYGGSNYGITTDCSPASNCHVNAPNLADSFDAAGVSWKGYFESMPATCGTANSGQYAVRHNPFVYFDDIRLNSARCAAHVVQYTRLANDLASNATTPNFAWITPN